MQPLISDVDRLRLISDAQLDWCSANSIDPRSALGEEAAVYLEEAFIAGCRTTTELIAALDQYVRERTDHVQLGSPAIPSSND